ncbi:hypothetical protein CerSpe_144180 [Prunus speciosa]|uniref:Uncharacterized protein LOC110774087 n=1 Tax=Prunus avium TaxID=42229 RepID=A0A6P5U5B7_PRUAV|nr:uncharacterized protein LOC110774087 [Prunus avium]
MDTELQLIKNLPALILRRNSSSNCRPDPEIEDEHRYTSLKDIILNSPQHSTTIPEESDFEFDPSNITIRNQLVKRAASAYVQSAAILASSRNQNFIVSFWGRLRGNVTSGSRWYAYVRSPIEACFRPILQFLACMVGNVRTTLINIPIS